MRIAFVNHSRRKVGGAEVYLDTVISAIALAGHEVACLCEDDKEYSDRELIHIPEGSPTLCRGNDAALALQQLAAWKPDVCFTHGLYDTDLEARVVDQFPSALYVHNYYGTCISGTKTHSTDTPIVCDRKFGPACLVHYLPDHCGGRNPLTMWQLYRTQSKRLDIMRRYRALVANSDYISREVAKYGLRSECVYYPLNAPVSPSAASMPPINDELKLVFAARMTSLKGGQYLLAALPDIERRLRKRIHLTMAGDGPDRAGWERFAATVRSNSISISFTGWLGVDGLKNALASCHLLVYPSIWPEPFGLSGLEAGLYGAPSVAFAVGGIPEWLHDGVNGHLATVGVQPLADAIVRCLADPEHYAQLRDGAIRRAQQYSLSSHLEQLLPILERCAR